MLLWKWAQGSIILVYSIDDYGYFFDQVIFGLKPQFKYVNCPALKGRAIY
jgi:hypothetical protein